jgi:hypothetical protein
MADTEDTINELNLQVTEVIASLREVEVEHAEISAKNQNLDILNKAVNFENEMMTTSNFEERRKQL